MLQGCPVREPFSLWYDDELVDMSNAARMPCERAI